MKRINLLLLTQRRRRFISTHESWVILLLLAIVGINACKSSKKTAIPEPLEGLAFYSSCYPIESLYVPTCKLEISDGDRFFPLNGSIYIQPDSICYFRGKLIVEAVRGVIYRDSFFIVNYIERTCYKGKNDYLQKITGYPVNPESLMMLFTADRCEDAYRNKLNFIIAAGSKDKIMMQGKNRSLLEMSINADNQTIEDVALYHNQQRQALFGAAYGGYTQYQQFLLPTAFDISAHDETKPIRIKANFQQILLNQPQQINFTVPSKYKTVILQ